MINIELASYYIIVSDQEKEIVRITKDGRVVLGPGASLDDASLEFWRALETSMPGMCQQILDSRQGRVKKP